MCRECDAQWEAAASAVSPRKKCAVRSRRPDFDGETELLKAPDEAVGECGFVPAVEVVGAEVPVVEVVFEHALGRDEPRRGDGEDGVLGASTGRKAKELVRQVVLNLLSNAVKFTPEGGRIDVGAVPKDGFVEVSVSDTGIGIAPEDQEKVFEEFRQVGTAAKKVEGTGLGLTLCRKFVELHGGEIWVKSELGAGSTFTFTIPARPSE